jgi:hypothetical protein
MNNNIENEKGWGLGITIIGVIIVLMILPSFYGFEIGPVKKGPASVLVGIYLQFWGLLFLLSYYYSHKSFFFRGLMWICENFSYPKGRKMAFFYFALAFGLISMGLIKGLGFFSSHAVDQDTIAVTPGIEPIENWWYKDPILYIVILVIVGVIFYRYKINKD